MLRAAMMALSIANISPAFAEREASAAVNTQTGTLGQQRQSAAAPRNGQVDVSPSDRTHWLFPPIGKYLVQ
jgi:hypothetical protein